jgi:hypothetical protein
MWFGATISLFGIGVFAITAFVSRLAGPAFGFFFAGFLLVHPMWTEIILLLTSDLFAFVGWRIPGAASICEIFSGLGTGGHLLRSLLPAPS